MAPPPLTEQSLFKDISNLYPLSDTVVLRKDSVRVLRFCSVTSACNQSRRGVERVAKVDALLRRFQRQTKYKLFVFIHMIK